MRKNLTSSNGLSNVLAGSVTGTTDPKPSRDRLFLPTLGSLDAFAFWLGLVLLLSLYGVVVQFDHITSVTHFGALFFDFFLVQFLVVFSIIGYTHLSIANYQSLSIFQQSKRIAITTLVFTPLATLLGKFIEITLGFQQVVAQNIFLEAMVNTVLAIMLVPLLLYYFSRQYTKILTAQQNYHQKLIHQNAQLKARITPHFFFNMLNTLQYLSETDPAKSNDLLQSIAKLYRVSFYDPTEIGVNEEIALCEHYLKVEQYRFGDKLQVRWQLPDEDSLYDMSIPSLMIQMTLEKLILAVVETMTQPIEIQIKLTWQDQWVTVVIITDLNHPSADSKLSPTLDFASQRVVLQQFYGETASIDTTLQSSSASPHYIVQICYPLAELV